MPKIKIITDNNTKIYPISITNGIYDTTKKQRLSVTLAAIESRLAALEAKTHISYTVVS